MSGTAAAENQKKHRERLPRWWNTLAFRIALLVNATVIGVLVSSETVDFMREQRTLKSQESAKLREEARVLSVAQRRLPTSGAYQSFLDDYCRQMSLTASPGHHIVVLQEDGEVFLRAHARATPELEKRMISAMGMDAEAREFRYRGQTYLLATARSDGGREVVVAQSLEPMLNTIGNRAINHLIGVGGLTLLIFAVTGAGLWWWIRRPLRQLVDVVAQVGRGKFDTRARGSGSAEVRYLANGVNDMAESLGRADEARRNEMHRARRIQQQLLPPAEIRIPGFSIASAFVPATSVAGDLFDCVELPDGSVIVLVIDVSGHGVPAALYTALLRTVMRYETRHEIQLDLLLARANRQLHEVSGVGDFATCFVTRITPDSPCVEFTKAGHDEAILLRGDGSIELLDCDGLPLGILADSAFEMASATFESGDRLILYTDGLHELFSPTGVQFGKQRLQRLVRETRACLPAEQVRHIIEATHEFQGSSNFDDDVTLICVQRD